MAGQSANESRKEIAKRLSELECTKSKPTGSGSNPHHSDDHYHSDKKKKGMY